MLKTLDICVVGGGIGGLAAATALAQRGAQVRVLEQASAISEVGAGLQISPNGFCVLRALGLSEAITRRSVRGRAVSLRRAEDDRQVARLDLSQLHDANGYHFMHRADLVDVLLEAAQTAGVQIVLDQTISAIAPGPRPAASSAEGTQHDADLVIDASGLHSVLRPVLNGPSDPFFTGQVAWRTLVPNAAGRADTVHVHMAPGAHIVSYPLRGGTVLNVVAVQERGAWADEGWSHRDDPAHMQAAFSGASPALREMLALADDVGLWGLFRHPVAATWHGQNVALLGDAAHPTLPFLAQGANMALEDAWALAACLDAFGAEQGLPAYQKLRRARAVRVISVANGNAKRYHLRAGPIRFAAHTGLSIVSRSLPRMMTKPFDWLYDYDIVAQSAAALR